MATKVMAAFVTGWCLGRLHPKPLYYGLYYMPSFLNPDLPRPLRGPYCGDEEDARTAHIDAYYRDLLTKMHE